MCGGTPSVARGPPFVLGLSPRVRGNRHLNVPASEHVRSIPACAGEPRVGQVSERDRPVYPRVCGGTGHIHSGGRLPSGLSPRVRGNPSAVGGSLPCPRSIPACAGEPHDLVPPVGDQTVYPRVCGGTLLMAMAERE